jgi:hypothetical protein
MDFIDEVASCLYVALFPRPLIRSEALALNLLKERIAELHGNSNREACSDCNKEYIRGKQVTLPSFGDKFRLIMPAQTSALFRPMRMASTTTEQVANAHVVAER